ncbi:MAG: DNA mismatch repair protein MutS, partial [Gammaproteobacteria bacterium]
MSKDDAHSFAELVGRVRRLEHESIEPLPRRTPPRRRAPADLHAPAADSWSDREPADHAPDDAHTPDDYQRNGVQRNVVRKLKRGQFPLVDEIDLHGRTLAEA